MPLLSLFQYPVSVVCASASVTWSALGVLIISGRSAIALAGRNEFSCMTELVSEPCPLVSSEPQRPKAGPSVNGSDSRLSSRR